MPLGHNIWSCAEEVPALDSSLVEADTRMIIHCMFVAKEKLADSTIIIWSHNTDVFVLLRFVQEIVHVVLFDVWIGNRRQLIEVKCMIDHTGKKLCLAFPALQLYSGCDNPSVLRRKLLKTLIKLVQAHPKSLEIFLKLADVTKDIYQSVSYTVDHPFWNQQPSSWEDCTHI